MWLIYTIKHPHIPNTVSTTWIHVVDDSWEIYKKGESNLTKNQIEYLKLLEDRRSNVAREVELNRSNLENERINQLNSDRTYKLGSKSLSESRRHNIVTENQDMSKFNRSQTETERHNLVLESNDARKAAASERSAEASWAHAGAAYASVQLGREQLTALNARENNALMEQRTHNRAIESETIRSNRMKEGIDQQRANAYDVLAGASNRQAFVSEQGQVETARHNRVAEGQQSTALSIQDRNASANMINATTNMVKSVVLPLIP